MKVIRNVIFFVLLLYVQLSVSSFEEGAKEPSEVVSVGSVQQSAFREEKKTDRASEILSSHDSSAVVFPIAIPETVAGSHGIKISERINYAKESCGSLVISSSPEISGSSSLIDENKDRYARWQKGTNPSIEIHVTYVMIENFEKFASRVKTIRVYGSELYPSDKWSPICQINADNVPGGQVFRLPDSEMKVYVRYVRFVMEDFFGNDFYVTLTTIRVFGETVLQGFVDPQPVIESFDHEDSHDEDDIVIITESETPALLQPESNTTADVAGSSESTEETEGTNGGNSSEATVEAIVEVNPINSTSNSSNSTNSSGVSTFSAVHVDDENGDTVAGGLTDYVHVIDSLAEVSMINDSEKDRNRSGNVLSAEEEQGAQMDSHVHQVDLGSTSGMTEISIDKLWYHNMKTTSHHEVCIESSAASAAPANHNINETNSVQGFSSNATAQKNTTNESNSTQTGKKDKKKDSKFHLQLDSELVAELDRLFKTPEFPSRHTKPVNQHVLHTLSQQVTSLEHDVSLVKTFMQHLPKRFYISLVYYHLLSPNSTNQTGDIGTNDSFVENSLIDEEMYRRIVEEYEKRMVIGGKTVDRPAATDLSYNLSLQQRAIQADLLMQIDQLRWLVAFLAVLLLIFLAALIVVAIQYSSVQDSVQLVTRLYQSTVKPM